MGKIRTRELVTMALLTALMFVGQVGMSFLPNIEVVSLLVIVYTQVYKKKVFFIIYAFAILEGLAWGFGVWWFGYLYIWSILAIVVLLIGKQTSAIVWSIVSGTFGLMYGFLYAIPYFIAGGWAAGFSYWISGIPFDIAHCIGNVVVALVLYKPVHTILTKLVQNQRQSGSSVNKIAMENRNSEK